MAKIIILTSDHLRHKFFVNTLKNYHKVLGVVSESKPITAYGLKAKEEPIVVDHFKERSEREAAYFGEKNHKFDMEDSAIRSIAFNEANSIETFEWIKSFSPETVILFGTAIIKAPLLTFYKDRIINLHLGLSPYYRGAATNFWPLVNHEPQCVGATIHKAILKVDAGDIFMQVRPDISPGDRCHDFGCKTIIKATHAMGKTISLLENMKIKSFKQPAGGRFYTMKNFTAEAVRTMRQNFESGMGDDYLYNKEKYDMQYPIIEQ